MATGWNRVFSRSIDSDYSQLPTQEPPSTDEFHSQGSPCRVAVERSENEGSLDMSARRTSGNLRFSDQVQFIGLGNVEFQSEQTESLHSSAACSARQVSGTVGHEAEEVEAHRSFRKTFTRLPSSESRDRWDNFVEKSWFQALSAVVIITNIITTIVEMDKPWTGEMLFIPDQVMLAFYVVELSARAAHFRSLYLCGPAKSVIWNVLDIIVVFSGVLDQWLMPVLPVRRSGVFTKVLRMLRLLRLLRVFKIVRVFLDVDLSWTEGPAFQSFIGLVILINSLLMGMEIDIPWFGWFYLEQVLLCVYVFELSVRLKNLGTFFFSCENIDITWNMLDFVIVTSSTLDSWVSPLCGVIVKSLAGSDGSHKKGTGMSIGKVMMLMRMLRLMRILRLAKLVKSVRPLFVLVTGIAAACQGVAWVLVLTIVILYAMGIVATSLIGKKMAFPPGFDITEEELAPFGTVPDSMFTLFRVMSGAASSDEANAIDNLMVNFPSIKLGFVFFMISSSWTLLSILTAVVSENMISTTGQQEEEHKLANAEEDRCEHIGALTKIFQTIDESGDGSIDKSEIDRFLSHKPNAVKTAQFCRVPIWDVREVLQTVCKQSEGNELSLETFVDCLADVGKVVTEKSVMKLEAKLTNILRDVEKNEALLLQILKTLHAALKENAVSTLEKAVETCSKAWQDKAEAACMGQLQEVKRFMQGLAEKTDVRLNDMLEKNQKLFENMSEALEQSLPRSGFYKPLDVLELQPRKLQQELLDNRHDQELSSTPAALDLDSANAVEPSETSNKELEKRPVVSNESQTDVADTARALSAQMEQSAIQVEAQVLAIMDSIRCLQQEAEYQRLSALAVEKLSETMESEFRVMRQVLPAGSGRHSPDSFNSRDTADIGRRLVPVVEVVAGRAMDTNSQAEARLLATKESIHGLQQKTILLKIQSLLDKAVDHGISEPLGGKISETLERELRIIRQELLCLGGQDLEASKARDGLFPKKTGPKKRAHEEVPIAKEGSSPRSALDRDE